MNSRTEGQFTLDVLAWVSSWATPAGALLGGGKDGGGPSGRGTYSGIPSHYSWLRKSSAQQVTFTDLDELDRAGAGSAGISSMALAMPVATNEAVRSWEEKVRARAVKVDARKGGTLAAARKARGSGGGA